MRKIYKLPICRTEIRTPNPGGMKHCFVTMQGNGQPESHGYGSVSLGGLNQCLLNVMIDGNKWFSGAASADLSVGALDPAGLILPTLGHPYGS